MSTFTITDASKKKEVEGRHGPMQVIIRQHSQTAAIALIEMAVGLGIIPKPESSAALLDLVCKTSDWLDKDVATTVANASLSIEDAQRRSEESF
jgi:hypothetical protein